jgi:hypothetical protein
MEKDKIRGEKCTEDKEGRKEEIHKRDRKRERRKEKEKDKVQKEGKGRKEER